MVKPIVKDMPYSADECPYSLGIHTSGACNEQHACMLKIDKDMTVRSLLINGSKLDECLCDMDDGEDACQRLETIC